MTADDYVSLPDANDIDPRAAAGILMIELRLFVCFFRRVIWRTTFFERWRFLIR
jgi:hypothetical protein